MLVSDSDSSEDSSPCRPKTRAAVFSYVEEDVEVITEALKEREKGIHVARKWLMKLRQEFGRDTRLDRDPDKDLKEPQEDTTYGYDEIVDDVHGVASSSKGPPAKSTRGRTKKRAKQKYKSTLLKSKIARSKRKHSKFCQPNIESVAAPTMDCGDVRYQIGDVMKIFLEDEELKSVTSKFDLQDKLGRIVQIVGFHKDQFCEKYATVRWLIVKEAFHGIDTLDPLMFEEGPLYPQPINLRDLEFVMRIDSKLTAKLPTHYRPMMKAGDEFIRMETLVPTFTSIDYHRSGPLCFMTD